MSHLDKKLFDKEVEETCLGIKNVLASKECEYSPGEDRLHSFNEIARRNKLSVQLVIWLLAEKHLNCVIDMVYGRLSPTPEMVREKIGDLINYLVILKAHFLNEIKLDIFLDE